MGKEVCSLLARVGPPSAWRILLIVAPLTSLAAVLLRRRYGRRRCNGEEALLAVGLALGGIKHEEAREVEESIALDMGGSLTKVLVIKRRASNSGNVVNPDDQSNLDPSNTFESVRSYADLAVEVPELGGTLYFYSFESRYMRRCVEFIRGLCCCEGGKRPELTTAKADSCGNVGADENPLVIRCTGGGGYSYASDFNNIGVRLDRRDEIACLVNGINFQMKYMDREIFSVSDNLTSMTQTPGPNMGFLKTFQERSHDPFPYLLVNVGSGVSVIKVDGPGNQFSRISGSTIGGGTLWGLCSLLTECDTFDQVIELTGQGRLPRVDSMVGDLYKGDYPMVGLKADIIASTFGKVVSHELRKGKVSDLCSAVVRAARGSLWLWLRAIVRVPLLDSLCHSVGVRGWVDRQASSRPFSPDVTGPDIALSVLRMVSNNVGQIGHLFAEKNGLKNIVFAGNFFRGHTYSMTTVSDAVNFWSGGTIQALFLAHEGFAGALGAHLCGTKYGLDLAGSVFYCNSDGTSNKEGKTTLVRNCKMDD